eukprot:g2985.t1
MGGGVSSLFMREKEVDLMRRIEAEDALFDKRSNRREKHAQQKRTAMKYVKDYIFAYAPLHVEAVLRDGKEHVILTMSKVSVEEKRKHKLIGYPDSAVVKHDGTIIVRKSDEFEQTISPEMLAASETSPPPKPSAPQFFSSSPSSIDIAWQVCLGFVISKYEVHYRALHHRTAFFKALHVGLKFSATLSGLTHAQWFEFRVRAKGPRGWSEWSDVSSPMRSSPLAPSRPRAPAVGKLTWESAEILWYAPTDNGETIVSYNVQCRRYRAPSPRDASSSGAMSPSWRTCRDISPNRKLETQSTTVDRLLPATEYEFRVCAVSNVGSGQWGQSLVIRTPGRSAKSDLRLLRETSSWSEMVDVSTGKTVYVNRRTQQKRLDTPGDFMRELGLMDEATRTAAEKTRTQQIERLFKTKRYRFVVGLHRDANRRRGAAPWDLHVRRRCIFEDAFEAFDRASVESDLGRRMRVAFEGEIGVDGGGLTKDMFSELSSAIRDPNRGLFKRVQETSSGWVYTFDDVADDGVASSSELPISPTSSSRLRRAGSDRFGGGGTSHSVTKMSSGHFVTKQRRTRLKYWRFCGLLVAKALFERKHMELPLSEIIWSHLVGRPVNFEVLESANRSLARSLRWIRENKVEGVLFETFSVTRSSNSAKTCDEPPVIVPLIRNGDSVDVTDANKLLYVENLVSWHTERKFGAALRAFKEGFYSLVPRRAVEVFSFRELERMVNGEATVDIDMLRRETVYSGDLDASSLLVEWLWAVLSSMTSSDRASFLRFVTGSSRMPLDGFDPPFHISSDSGADPKALPTSHTCFNELVLPRYTSRGALEERISYALQNSGKAFLLE